MARKVSVEIVGDASSLQRSFRQASEGTQQLAKDLGRSTRGMVAASLSFHGLGRAALYASGSLLAGGGLVVGLKSSIQAAENLDKAQRSLAVVIKRNGGNVRDQIPAINAWAKAQTDVGISAVQAEQGLARATAITGTAKAGMRSYTEALLIAKATGKSFNSVLIAAAKANEGQTTALARYIGHIAKGTTATQLYNEVLTKYRGQAAANTTATDKLHAALSNVQLTIGQALLPTVERLATHLTNWLDKSQNQARVQRDLAIAVKDTTAVIRALSAVVHTAADAVGGFKHLLELLIALRLASLVAGWAGSFSRLSNSIRSAGTSATVAQGEVAGLRGSLLGLNALTIAPIVIPIEMLIEKKIVKKLGSLGSIYDNVVGFLSGGAVGNNPVSSAVAWALGGGGNKSGSNTPSSTGYSPSAEAAAKAAAGIAHSTKSVAAAAGGQPALDRLSQITLDISNARTAVARGEAGAKQKLVAALKELIDFDRKYEAVQESLIKRHIGNLSQHAKILEGLQSSEQSSLSEIASLAKVPHHAAKHHHKHKAHHKAAKVPGYTIPIGLQLAQAEASATATQADDIRVAHEIKAAAERAIKSGKLGIQAQIDAWNVIAQQNTVLANSINQSTSHITQASSRLLTAGLGLTEAQRKALEQRISQAEAHGGRYRPGVVGAGGAAVVVNGDIHLHNVEDPAKLAAQLQKRAKRGATTSSGQNPGSYMGLH